MSSAAASWVRLESSGATSSALSPNAISATREWAASSSFKSLRTAAISAAAMVSPSSSHSFSGEPSPQ